jgi:hypothetical protein
VSIYDYLNPFAQNKLQIFKFVTFEQRVKNRWKGQAEMFVSLSNQKLNVGRDLGKKFFGFKFPVRVFPKPEMVTYGLK